MRKYLLFLCAQCQCLVALQRLEAVPKTTLKAPGEHRRPERCAVPCQVPTLMLQSVALAAQQKKKAAQRAFSCFNRSDAEQMCVSAPYHLTKG